MFVSSFLALSGSLSLSPLTAGINSVQYAFIDLVAQVLAIFIVLQYKDFVPTSGATQCGVKLPVCEAVLSES